MVRGEPSRSGSQLPAPYRSPWSGLAEALAAVFADARLRLQRLWRRNREGDLPLPAIWPRNLAPLFWPLLLSAALALLFVLGGWLLQLAMASRAALPAATGDAPSGLRQERPATAPPARQEAAAPPGAAAAGSGPVTPRPSSQGQAALSGTGGVDRPAPAPAGTDEDTAAGGPAATALQLDPLLELLSQGQDAKWLLAARPDPARSRLSLTLSDAAEALPQAVLLEQAQRWQQRAHDAGYERLELRDRQGHLRGREALVGSGMILLAPVPGS